jgi:hypothetical protein
MPPVFAAVGAVVSAIGGALGIGAAATGIMGVIGSLGAAALISGAISIGRSLLSGGKAPEPSRANLDRLRASIDVRTPRKSATGWTAMACEIR